MKPVDPRVILPFLQKLQRVHQLQTCAALLGGLALSLAGPMFVTLCFLLFSLTLILDRGFWGAYWIITAVTLPVFFGFAAWLRGSVLEHMVPDGDTISGMIFRRTVLKVLIVLELANIGPRLVLWAVGRYRGRRRVRRMKLGRVAQCVATLSQTDGGVSPARLLFPEESADKLEPLLAFLIYHEIVDLSKQGDRVWLTSNIRRRLEEAAP